MRILGIDPGKASGYSLIVLEGKTIVPTPKFGVDRDGELTSIRELIVEGVDHVVIEDFKVRPGNARRGNFDYDDMLTPRQIGRIEEICELTETPYSKQQASLKPPAYGFAGMKYSKGKKNQHWQDAFAHACYYAVKFHDARPVKSSKKD